MEIHIILRMSEKSFIEFYFPSIVTIFNEYIVYNCDAFYIFWHDAIFMIITIRLYSFWFLKNLFSSLPYYNRNYPFLLHLAE